MRRLEIVSEIFNRGDSKKSKLSETNSQPTKTENKYAKTALVLKTETRHPHREGTFQKNEP